MSGRRANAVAHNVHRILLLIVLVLLHGTLQHKVAGVRALLGCIRRLAFLVRGFRLWPPERWFDARRIWNIASDPFGLQSWDLARDNLLSLLPPWNRSRDSSWCHPAPTHLELSQVPTAELDRASQWDGHTLLTLACSMGELECVRSLLALGASPGPLALPDVGLYKNRLRMIGSVWAPPPCALGGATIALKAGHHAVVRELVANGAPLDAAPLRFFMHRAERRALQWELVRVRALAFTRRCALKDRAVRDRVHRALRLVTGGFGHVPDGPFQLIVAHLWDEADERRYERALSRLWKDMRPRAV